MQRRDVEEIERHELGDMRRGTPASAVTGERSTGIGFLMEKAPQTSDGSYNIT